MAFAGLWESWPPRRGPAVETCSIITGAPNDLVAPIHNRMPVVLQEADHARWLGQEPADADEIKAMLRPIPSDRMQIWSVDRRVGNVAADEPSLIEPVTT